MKGLHKQTLTPKTDVMSWMKEDEVAKGRKEEIRATTKIILHLIDYMERHQMSQTDLARELGVTPQYINKLLHGQDKSFRIETAIEYGRKLGIELVSIPDPEDVPDAAFIMWLASCCWAVPSAAPETGNSISSFISDVFKSSNSQKWTPLNQLVIA